jgi:small subunit ribosomal protein S17
MTTETVQTRSGRTRSARTTTAASTAVVSVRGKRKTKVGHVVSDKMDKTIVVSVERLSRHPLYKRVIRLTTKFKAHDEQNDAHLGDTVLIEESRPLSATKRWRLVRIIARAGEHAPGEAPIAEEAETLEAIHGAAHPGREHEHGEAADAPASTQARAETAAPAPAETAAPAPAEAPEAEAPAETEAPA